MAKEKNFYWQSLTGVKKSKHQNLDPESITWLEMHRPKDIRVFKGFHNDQFIDLTQALKPWRKINSDFFYSTRQAHGIHGIRHALRVSLFAIFLALEQKCDDIAIKKVLYAGLLHDCRRKNDNTDNQHGVRAKTWIENRYKHLLPKPLHKHAEEISTAVGYHNANYKDFEDNKAYLNFKETTDILKSADALDRYRFPKTSWWINKNYLKIIPKRELHSFAFDLILTSEKLFSERENSASSVETAWKSLAKLRNN